MIDQANFVGGFTCGLILGICIMIAAIFVTYVVWGDRNPVGRR